MTKERYMSQLLARADQGECLIVAGVGSGLTARGAAGGGADLLCAYNTAAYRIQGLPTAMAFLPYDDCNSLAFEIAPQVIAAAGETPVALGLGAHDPRRNLERMVEQAARLGAAGVTNEPFIGMYEGDLRRQMEAAGFGFRREVELIRTANRRGLLTLGYVFTPEEAVTMADAGVDLIGAMVGGVTSGGAAGGAATIDLSDAIRTVDAIIEALDRTGRRIPVLPHGGPLNDVGPVQTVFSQTRAMGYVTGSTGERLPTEQAVREKIASFKAIQRGVTP